MAKTGECLKENHRPWAMDPITAARVHSFLGILRTVSPPAASQPGVEEWIQSATPCAIPCKWAYVHSPATPFGRRKKGRTGAVQQATLLEVNDRSLIDHVNLNVRREAGKDWDDPKSGSLAIDPQS